LQSHRAVNVFLVILLHAYGHLSILPVAPLHLRAGCASLMRSCIDAEAERPHHE
jgi:hypothetical protein